VRSADWRTTQPTSPRVGNVVRPRVGAVGLAQVTYEQPLGIGGSGTAMHRPTFKAFAASQYQEDP